MYGVFNVGLFTFINGAGCFLFQFQVMKFFSMSQFDNVNSAFNCYIYLVQQGVIYNHRNL